MTPTEALALLIIDLAKQGYGYEDIEVMLSKQEPPIAISRELLKLIVWRVRSVEMEERRAG